MTLVYGMLFSPLLCFSRNVGSPGICRLHPGVCKSPRAPRALNPWMGCAELLLLQNVRMSLAQHVSFAFLLFSVSCSSWEGDCAHPWLSWAILQDEQLLEGELLCDPLLCCSSLCSLSKTRIFRGHALVILLVPFISFQHPSLTLIIYLYFW